MKILIKSVEEIKKTLDKHNAKDRTGYDEVVLGRHSGKVFDTEGATSEDGAYIATGWAWHQDWVHVLPEGYNYEKFESLSEVVYWTTDKGAILSDTGHIVHNDWRVLHLVENWKSWHKAIPIKPKDLKISWYVNVYEDGNCSYFYKTKEDANTAARSHRIDCKKIELNYEFKDGKWVEV